MGKDEKGIERDYYIEKKSPNDRVIALAGNPNVGKSTVFNTLTGMKQHTGNWSGKTVVRAEGTHTFNNNNYIIIDLPGTYSLMAHSSEEEIARNFILFGGADATVVVCDATCLERNLNLVLQIMEITPKVVVCVNLMDEAKKKNISVDLENLEKELGVPVVGTNARNSVGIEELMKSVEAVCSGDICPNPRKVRYTKEIEQSMDIVLPTLEKFIESKLLSRWLSLRLIEQSKNMNTEIQNRLETPSEYIDELNEKIDLARSLLKVKGIGEEELSDKIVSCIVLSAEEIMLDKSQCNGCRGCCNQDVCSGYKKSDVLNNRDRKLDKILISKRFGIPIMLSLLCGVFWITITGANYPSQLLSGGLFWIQDRLTEFFHWLGTPEWVHGALVLGVYRVVAWVVAVMLPPMAIFFPLFTLLEDFGYLPRIAFNLDHQFKKAKTCGKQALTMCMGFGCNATGVIGCRIIDSPRERLIAILTNSFVPCNGRFPTLIAIITMFFVGATGGIASSFFSTIILTGVIVLGVALTFIVSRLLSQTILKGEPSSFTLELPPFRTPQFGKVIVRSIFNRTLFVLFRAISVAAPAGLVIWIFSNVMIGDMSVLKHCSIFLDPFAQLFGLDGVILLAFILGFPANEIVVPIIIMAYMSTDRIIEMDNLSELKTLLVSNGWTWVTAVSTMLFCLVHWPCSTTCLTIKKETGSVKWTLVSVLLPTLIGLTVCFIFNSAVRIIGLF